MFDQESTAAQTIEKNKSQTVRTPIPSIGKPSRSRTGNSKTVSLSGVSNVATEIKTHDKTSTAPSENDMLIPYV